MSFKSGFVGLVGPTNSGKSTLLNALIGEKVSIVSERAQTTYHSIRGILNVPGAQIVFTDTPGFQRHTEQVARLLNRVAEKYAKECEIFVWVFDASNKTVLRHVSANQDRIAGFGKAAVNICVLNKVDKCTKETLLPMIAEIHASQMFSEIIPISAQNKDGLDRLIAAILEKLPEGVPLFPEDMITDRSAQFLVSEFVREKIYEFTRQELPYSARVEIEGWEGEDVDSDLIPIPEISHLPQSLAVSESEVATPSEPEPTNAPEAASRKPLEKKVKAKVPTIRAIIHVDASSRKAILIGKGGSMLKEIGSAARKDIEHSLGHQVCLKLFVDVEREWKRDSRLLGRYLEL